MIMFPPYIFSFFPILPPTHLTRLDLTKKIGKGGANNGQITEKTKRTIAGLQLNGWKHFGMSSSLSGADTPHTLARRLVYSLQRPPTSQLGGSERGARHQARATGQRESSCWRKWAKLTFSELQFARLSIAACIDSQAALRKCFSLGPSRRPLSQAWLGPPPLYPLT